VVVPLSEVGPGRGTEGRENSHTERVMYGFFRLCYEVYSERQKLGQQRWLIIRTIFALMGTCMLEAEGVLEEYILRKGGFQHVQICPEQSVPGGLS